MVPILVNAPPHHEGLLRTHDRLRKLWLSDNRLFAELSPTEQWQLHDFVKPDKDWTDLALLQHRVAITKERPSLPHQAGRALEKFWATSANLTVKRVRAATVPVGSTKRVRQQDRKITIKGVARPEIDTKKLARAFIYLARDQAKKRAAAEAESEDQDSRSRP